MAYRTVGLVPPRIVWHDGPISLATSWASAPSCAGTNTSDIIVAAPHHRVIQQLNTHSDRCATSLRTQFDHDRSSAVSSALAAAVIENGDAVRPSMRTWLRRLSSSLLDNSRQSRFSESGSSQHELCRFGYAAELLEMLEPHPTGALRGLRLIAENAGWILPHKHVCWLADRPAGLCFDIWGRLHSSSGPALFYGDGWSVYAWKGKRVPRWIIDEPERITLNWIDAQIDPLVRHAMIDIFTPERFVEAGGARRLASDATGTIWFRKWSYRGAVIDTWAAIEFPAEGGARALRCIPTHLRTPEEALAWLFGHAPSTGERHPQPRDSHRQMHNRRPKVYEVSSRAASALRRSLPWQDASVQPSSSPQAGRPRPRHSRRKDERVVPIATRKVDDRE
jgi:hypothetical protein